MFSRSLVISAISGDPTRMTLYMRTTPKVVGGLTDVPM